MSALGNKFCPLVQGCHSRMTDNVILLRQTEITFFGDIVVGICLAHNLPLNMEVLSLVLQIPYMFAELSTIPPIGHIKRAFVVSESCLEFSRGQAYVGFFFSFLGHTCLVHHILGLACPINWAPWLVSAVTTSTSNIAHNILPLLAVICLY